MTRYSALRLLFVAEYYPFFAARLLREIAKRLVAKGCEVTILTSNYHWNAGGSNETENGIRVTRFNVLPVNISSTIVLLPHPREIKRIRDVLRREIGHTDIIHFETGHGSLNILASILLDSFSNKHQRTLVYTSHGIPAGYDSFFLNSASLIANRVIRHLIIEKCRLVTTIAKRDLEYWVARGVSRDKIVYIPNGVDTGIFLESSDLRDKYRKQLGFDSEDFVILFLAQFRRAKGLNVLMAAIPEIVSRVPNAKFLLVGSGPMVPDVQAFIERLNLHNSVKLCSRYVLDEELPGLYNASDVYLLPSHVEGMPLSLMEAMACGKPVVATNVGDTRFLVKNGINGFLIPPNNSQAVVRGIAELSGRPELRNAMGDNNMEEMSRYDWDLISNRYLQAYLRLMQTG
jgi:glycosyltransferase involved in cell wall biosynthesis